MLTKGDKLIVTKDVASFLREGEIVEVIDIEGDMISFVFGNGMHKGLMNYAECESHFEKYEEPKKASPTVPVEYIEYLIDNSDINVQTVYDKCTIVTCKLPNGFVIVESSVCPNSEIYDEDMEVEICMDKIFDKVLELEGYAFQNKLYEEEAGCPYGCDDCDECPCDEECELDEEECKDECIETDSNCNNCTEYDCPFKY